MSCEAELCPNWTGQGCICEVLDLPRVCGACGGTGDEFDEEADDWVSPLRNCPKCRGTGEVNQ